MADSASNNLAPEAPRAEPLLGRVFDSRAAQVIARTPPFSWLIRAVSAGIVRRQLKRGAVGAVLIGRESHQAQSESVLRLILDIQRSLNDEQGILERIVRGVVDDLGYAGAMVATYEPETDALPVRAIYVNPQIAGMDQVTEWERQLAEMLPAGRTISLSNPEVARVYVHKLEYAANLSVRAAEAGRPVTSGWLYDLFTPIAPAITEPAIRGIQDALGIRQMIAVPFFLEAEEDAELRAEPRLIGNLFAVTQAERFELWEIDLLQAFGRQAAAGLSNARLYRVSENRRAAGEILGRMAFSSAASVHAFRNHLGLIRGNLQLLEKLDILAPDEAQRRELMGKLLPPVMDRLGQITRMLDGLHTPWNLTSNTPVDVNQCITRAVSKIIQTPEEWVHLDLAEGLPCVTTTPDMLTEAFRTLVKNAVEAMEGIEPEQRGLWVESRQAAGNVVEITIRDAGTGIRPEHLSKVFEMRWSTKPQGLGFGLFWTRDFVEGLGGQIRLKSVWGEGSTFVVRLPAAE